MATTLLKVSGLKVAYGGIQAVKGEYFEVWMPAAWGEQMTQLQDTEANNARFSTLDLSKSKPS